MILFNYFLCITSTELIYKHLFKSSMEIVVN